MNDLSFLNFLYIESKCVIVVTAFVIIFYLIYYLVTVTSPPAGSSSGCKITNLPLPPGKTFFSRCGI